MSQIIGLDIGRGYTKCYSEVNGMKKECKFKSVIGEGRGLDFSDKTDPIYINVNDEDYFVGTLAEKESYSPMRNSKDSKVSITAEVLMAAALNSVAVEDEVNIMLGVPYKSFNKATLNEVTEFYKDKTYKIKDNINGGYKNITIKSVMIARESDSALFWEVKDSKTNNKAIGMVNIGFRTSEFSYFEPGLKFNDRRSKTIEYGNKDILAITQDKLLRDGISKEVYEIDGNNDYNTESAYKIASEKISQNIEDIWINTKEMNVYIAGGTALNMKFDKEYKVIDDAQMATSKGLYLTGTKVFK